MFMIILVQISTFAKGLLFWRCCLLCCCLLFLVGCQSPTELEGTFTVQVQRVVSGQTLEVLDVSKQPPLIERVRLIGIDAPDLRQEPWGSAAKQSLEQMIGKVNGQQLILQSVMLEPDVQKKDNFGRWLAYVWQDDVLVNKRLVEEGHALAVPRSPNNKYDGEFAYAQEYARIMGYGIWNPDKPMRVTPREFRKNPY